MTRRRNSTDFDTWSLDLKTDEFPLLPSFLSLPHLPTSPVSPVPLECLFPDLPLKGTLSTYPMFYTRYMVIRTVYGTYF